MFRRHSLNGSELFKSSLVIVLLLSVFFVNWGCGGGSPKGGGGGGVTVPAAPAGLAATAGNGQVALTWNASTGASSYSVKRGTATGGPYTTIASPTAASYTDTTAQNGTLYYYVVSAVNSAGESSNSSEVSATPAPLPSNTALPSFSSSSGGLNMGATLTGDVGSWNAAPSPTFTCAWYINDRIAQAAASCDNLSNRSQFYLKNYYYGEVPSLVVTATNSAGSATATSAPTATYITRAATQAVRADDFNDAIGTAAHMEETGTEFWSGAGYSYSFTNVSTALTYLPYLNHLRSPWPYGNNANMVHQAFLNVTFVVGAPCCQWYDGPATQPVYGAEPSKAYLLANAGTVEAIEGANEIDLEPNFSCPIGGVYPTSCPGNNHPPTPAQQNAGYANAKANQPIVWSDFSAVFSVLSPTMQIPSDMSKIYGAGSTGVNPSNIDFVNEHHYTQYQGGQAMQWSDLYARDFQASSANGVAPVRGGVYKEILERPTIITETGWMDCPLVSGSCKFNTPEATIAKLLPSTLLDAHNAGVYRTFIYQLLDAVADPGPTGAGSGNEEAHHGLFSLDTPNVGSTVSPKPQATSLKNLMAFMHDSGASAKTFQPGQWSYTLTGLPDSGSNPPYQKGQSLLFQRADGKFILAVWDDVVLWDFTSGTAMPGVPALTHPALAPAVVPSAVSQYDPVTDTTTPLTLAASMTLDLPDHPIFLLITP